MTPSWDLLESPRFQLEICFFFFKLVHDTVLRSYGGETHSITIPPLFLNRVHLVQVGVPADFRASSSHHISTKQSNKVQISYYKL